MPGPAEKPPRTAPSDSRDLPGPGSGLRGSEFAPALRLDGSNPATAVGSMILSSEQMGQAGAESSDSQVRMLPDIVSSGSLPGSACWRCMW